MIFWRSKKSPVNFSTSFHVQNHFWLKWIIPVIELSSSKSFFELQERANVPLYSRLCIPIRKNE
jgi:hypothetical protein